jgi:hypothetical protein
MARFTVRRVDDLPARTGLLASGTAQDGTVAPGMTLTAPTGERWRVLAIEHPTPRALREGRTTLLVTRTGTPPPVGAVLTA